jgi:hypothetical protein
VSVYALDAPARQGFTLSGSAGASGFRASVGAGLLVVLFRDRVVVHAWTGSADDSAAPAQLSFARRVAEHAVAARGGGADGGDAGGGSSTPREPAALSSRDRSASSVFGVMSAPPPVARTPSVLAIVNAEVVGAHLLCLAVVHRSDVELASVDGASYGGGGGGGGGDEDGHCAAASGGRGGGGGGDGDAEDPLRTDLEAVFLPFGGRAAGRGADEPSTGFSLSYVLLHAWCARRSAHPGRPASC